MIENHGLILYFVSNANKLNLFTNIPVFVKYLDAHIQSEHCTSPCSPLYKEKVVMFVETSGQGEGNKITVFELCTT